ncbi:MAG TPA: SDR family NAD(P)-dependent oxidoreductase [Vicinamibacterales bacterium]|nr:SDR family NAD(P)-dependent oxidoreductase [Vicinamibacterales bacterium]
MEMRFSADRVENFAKWSADRNPLHVDATFARQTHFGRPIVHGVLTVLEALGSAAPPPGSINDLGALTASNVDQTSQVFSVKATAPPEAGQDDIAAGEASRLFTFAGLRLASLDIEFRSAAVVGGDYVTRSERQGEELVVTAQAADQQLLSIRAALGPRTTPDADAAWVVPSLAGTPLRDRPAEHALADFEQGVTVTGSYPLDVAHDPAADAAGLGHDQARVLALCSYITGMELPGLKSLFTRITVRFHADAGGATELWFRARTTRFDRHFRLLDTELHVSTPAGAVVATALLRSYVPLSPAVPDVSELARRVHATTAARGQVALVIGGSRGLGAELTAGLALAGYHVYASSRHGEGRDEPWLGALSERDAKVEFVHGDAGDRRWCEETLDHLRARHGRLDVLVLNACAPPGVLRMGPGSAERSAKYVRENLQLVEAPLAAFAELLEHSAGRVVHISSSFVQETPAGFGHYVAVKQAAEGLVRTVCRERPRMAGVIVRPPVLRTRWNDTPAGIVSAIPSERAAVHTINTLAGASEGGQVTVVSEFPAFAATPAGAPVSDSPLDFSIRVAATFTIDPLLPALDFWAKELDLSARVEAAPYGQVLQSLLDPASLLNARDRGVNVVLLRVRDWLRELADEQAGDIEFVRQFLHDTVRDFARALNAHRAQATSETLLLVCPSHGALSAAESILLRQAELELAEATGGITGLDVVFAGDDHDRYDVNEDEVHDPLRDDLAHIPYRPEYLGVLATIAMRHLHRRTTPPRKVVVVDCDNTLWHGVVGEVGAEGVEFDAGHRALHETLVRLAQSGVLVCLCSKNEEADVWRVFETRPDLLLPREHVVAAVVNWLPKSQNLRTLADRLNLGLDSFVFVDDNPVECAEVQAGCPEVLTIQWPEDAARAERLLRHVWEFDSRTVTREDERRTELYKQEFRRQEARAETLTFADFIDDLQLAVDIAPLTAADLRRASQLTLRTNQFNFTTIRRDESELQALWAAGRHDVRTVRVRDRFGDYGLVGLIIAERGPDVWTLDTFLLSCRVLGRGVEHSIFAGLGRLAADAGATTVKLRVDATKRNTPARAFVESVLPSEWRHADELGMAGEVPADVLAAIRFEPATAPEVVIREDNGKGAAAQPMDARRLRRREAQITRAAFDLATGPDLRLAIEGRSAPSSVSVAPSEDIAAIVHDTFAHALGTTAERVAAIDDLEPLGCDSLRIVEITVALTEKFPWLPSTLLFEHRSISQIVSEIARLSRGADEPAAVPAPAAAMARSQAVGTSRSTEIAVVGLHVRCADVNSPDDLWTLLSEGRSAVKPVPADRPYFLQPLTDSRPHWAGLVERPAQFDAEFFGVSPREAEFMDPQLRLILEVAWAAIEDAGSAGGDHDSHTGVFVGVMYGDYGFRANAGAAGANPYRCWEGFSLANRLSQLLGFHGPSLAVDTACSSSGTALHLACAALNAGDCNVALVGGVNLILDPDRFASLGRLGILSARGQCEPFGADADGTVLGEGAGVVVLRPLDEAVRRGDRIYGVIKGTGLSTGSGTVGFTAPNPQAQAQAIRRALETARVDPRTVSYIETHGTGTALGDPIEVRGLTLGYDSPELQDPAVRLTQRATIGSIKPNVGHLEAGAGIVGLIKVLLQLHRGQLLPSLTSPQPNTQISFEQGPFDVQRVLSDWPRPTLEVQGLTAQVPRRAGLSSFGVGGANAHVIVEEAPAAVPVKNPPERPKQMLALSARTAQALRQQAAALGAHLDRHDTASIDEVCFSVNTGRRHFAHRLAIGASGHHDLRRALGEVVDGQAPRGSASGVVSAATKPKIAFLFTGQGSQYAGMGRQLYASQPVFRDALDRCAAIFDSLLDRPLLDLLFAEEGSAEADLLNHTAYTQPALFAFEYAVSEMWQSWGIRPDVVLGHSVGEIGAMCVAGGISLEDGLKLIAARGRLMQALPAGGVMTSVMADETRVLEAIAGAEELVAIAAINAPGQVVISGAGTAVAEIEARLTANGIKTKALTVSHAFHSPLMRPMLAEYEQVVRQIRFTQPRVPLVTGVDGLLAGDEVTRTEYWLRNVIEPVRFAVGVRTLETEKVTAFVEVGPHPVLLGMARQCVADDGTPDWLPSLRKDADAWETLLGSVATLYTHGADVDWRGFDAPYAPTRVTVPTYPFAAKAYWLRSIPALADAPPATEQGPRDDAVAAEATGPALYEMVWRQALAPAAAAAATGHHWIVVADYGGIGEALVKHLTESGAAATLVPGDTADIAAVWEDVSVASPGAAPGVVYLPGLDALPATALTRSALEAELDRILGGAMRLTQAAATGRLPEARVWFVTRNAVSPPLDTTAPVSLAAAPLWGFARTFAIEHPDHHGGIIDLSLDGAPAVRALAAELLGGGIEDQVALGAAGRHVLRLAPASSAPPTARAADGTYLVTGGVGALGLRVAHWLAAHGVRHLVLASRRATLTPDARAAVNAWRTSGVSVTIVRADVSQPEDVDRLLAAIPSEAPLSGIVHAAGVDTSRPVGALSQADLRSALGGKAIGAWLLHERTRHLELESFVCFSSMSSLLGAYGRAHYAAANAFLDALILERRRLGLAGTTANWGPWSGGGMASAQDLAQFARSGNRGLDPADALRLLDGIVGGTGAPALVADVEWPLFRQVYEARRARPILSELGQVTSADQVSDDTAAPWVTTLRPIASADRVERLAGLLRHEVADTLGFDDDDSVPLEGNFYELGMDSLMMADFVGRLKTRVGMSCTALAFNHPSVQALAARMVEHLPIDSAAALPQTAGRASVAGAGSAPAQAPFDEAELLAFQYQGWPHRRADLVPARWRWMFVDSARRLGREPRFWTHREAAGIVGYMGSIPVRVKLNDQERDTGWLVDTMVLKEYRTQAIGSRLMVEAHDDQPFSLSLGQTSEMREIQFRLGWKQVAPLAIAQLLVRPGNVLKGKVPPPAAWVADVGLRASSALRDLMADRAVLTVRHVDRFDERHDALWASASRDVACAVVRDASYLNWKYVDQPGQTFLRLEVSDARGLAGVAVWMFREPDGIYRYRRALLVDLVAPFADASRLQHVVKAACGAATEQGADALLCHHVNPRLTSALRSCGFHLRKPERFFLVDPGPLAEPLLAQVLSADNWLVTHGDSDIDRPW